MTRAKFIIAGAGLVVAGIASGAPGDLLQRYSDAGAGPFSADAGRAAWEQSHQPAAGADARSCTSCHGKDISQPGRHIKTGKTIKPMALSANPARLSDPKKAEKWFRRNCRWTLGRECTPQEKGDFIQFITSQ